jgi:2-C-methyl-D-erythritol 4-phosphate cytidylyltransferase
MKKYAVIVAGGSGSRMNNATPKQFLLLNWKPVLYYPIDTFLRAYDDMEIILVLPEVHLESGQAVIDEFFQGKPIRVTTGGSTRFHSVQNGLDMINEECIIFVHDAVRCLLSTDLVHRCYNTAVEYGSAIPVVDCKDSVRLVKGDINEALERSAIKLVQTPQTFHSNILLPAYKVDHKDKFTDEAAVVEDYGHKVHVVEGEENNFKITTPVDLVIAEQILLAE